MEKFKKTIITFLILTLLVGLTVSFRTFIMDFVIEPIALLFWAVWRIVFSVDQNVYWVVLIIFCTILMIRLIPSERDNFPSPAYNRTNKPPNRVEYWHTLINESILGRNKSEYLRNRIKELIMTVISQGEQPTTTGADEMIASGFLPLPPAARQYLLPPNGKDGISFIKDQLNNNVFAPRWLRRWRRKHNQQNNTMLDEILTWMETELEINNER